MKPTDLPTITNLVSRKQKASRKEWKLVDNQTLEAPGGAAGKPVFWQGRPAQVTVFQLCFCPGKGLSV